MGEVTTGALRKVKAPETKRGGLRRPVQAKPKANGKPTPKQALRDPKGKEKRPKLTGEDDVESALSISQPDREVALARSASALLQQESRPVRAARTLTLTGPRGVDGRDAPKGIRSLPCRS